jgi:hypothetical protein
MDGWPRAVVLTTLSAGAALLLSPAAPGLRAGSISPAKACDNADCKRHIVAKIEFPPNMRSGVPGSARGLGRTRGRSSIREHEQRPV